MIPFNLHAREISQKHYSVPNCFDSTKRLSCKLYSLFAVPCHWSTSGLIKERKCIIRLDRPIHILRKGSSGFKKWHRCRGRDGDSNHFAALVYYRPSRVPGLNGNRNLNQACFTSGTGKRTDRTFGEFWLFA